MTKPARRYLFILLVLAFLILAPLAVLWAQGYRFDFSARRLTQVGALDIRTNLAGAKIKIADRPVAEARAGILYAGAVLRNLLPQKYAVTVEAGEDYWPWKKNLDVKPLTVTKATKVTLVPRKADVKPGSADRPLILEGSNYLVYRPDKNPAAEPLGRYLANLFKPQEPPRVLSVKYRPENPRFIYLLTDNGIYRIDTVKNEYWRMVRPPVTGLGVANNNSIYYLAVTGIWEMAENETAIPKKVLTLKSVAGITDPTEIASMPDGKFLVYAQNGTLLVASPEGKTEIISKNAGFAALSPDRQKLAFIGGKTLRILPLRFDLGEDIALTNLQPWTLKTFETLPRGIFWLKDSWHLAAVFDDNIEIVEIDPRQPVNADAAQTGSIKSFAFDPHQNKFYWRDQQGNLLSWTIQ